MSHLDLITILCDKLEATKDFYISRLGFRLVEEFSSPNGDFAWLSSERGSNIALQDASTRGPKITLAKIPMQRGGLMLGFFVENAREAYKEWTDAGLETRTEMFDMKKGETFGAYDPEGNFIQIYDVYPEFREIQRKLGLE